MGKKRTRKTVVSKGQRRNIVAGVKEVRQSVTEFDKALNKIEAWRKGKNPWITVPGPSSNKPFVKVRANNVYGDCKRTNANLFGGKSDAQ
jgi:hypothetical protein